MPRSPKYPLVMGKPCKYGHDGLRYSNPDGTPYRCVACKRAINRKHLVSHREGRLWRGARLRAKKYGVPFTISVEDIIIPDFCPVFGYPLVPSERVAKAVSPSLDRLIPEFGYVPGNIRVISHRANTLRSNGTVEEWEALIIDQRGIESETRL